MGTSVMNGEKIYEYNLALTGATDFGVSLEAILSGEARVPPQGARVDVSFEGEATGRLKGKVRGIDYICIRADGRIELDIKGVIETEDGRRIALSASGVGAPRPGEPVADLFENVTLVTAAPTYEWVSRRQIWGIGTVNFATAKVHVEAYLQ